MDNQQFKTAGSEDIDPKFIKRLKELGGTKLVSELIQMYLVRGSQLMETIAQGMAAKDLDSIQNAAHSLISSAGNLGGQRVSNLSATLEGAAIDGKTDIISVVSPELFSAQKSFQEYLKEALEQL